MNGWEMARALVCGDGEPPLPFQRWRALAPLLAGREADERAALVTANAIDPACWERADGYWNLTLAAECARGDRSRAEDFGRACAEAMEARRQAPSGATEDTLPEGVAPPEVPPSMPVVGPEPPAWVAPVPERGVPTFLRAVEPEWSAGTAAGGTQATLEMGPFAGATGRAALPFCASPGGMPKAPPPRPSGLPPQSGATLDLSSLPLPRSSTETVALDPDLVARVLAGNPPRRI